MNDKKEYTLMIMTRGGVVCEVRSDLTCKLNVDIIDVDDAEEVGETPQSAYAAAVEKFNGLPYQEFP